MTLIIMHDIIRKSFTSCWKPRDGERYIYVGDGKMVQVATIEKFRLLLKTMFYFDLDGTFTVPIFR